MKGDIVDMQHDYFCFQLPNYSCLGQLFRTAYYLLLIRLQTDRILQNGISAVSITLLSGRGLAAAAGVQQPGVWRTGMIDQSSSIWTLFGNLKLQPALQLSFKSKILNS